MNDNDNGKARESLPPPLNIAAIPAALRERRQWVCWKTVVVKSKPTKVPFQPSGAEAKSNDPSTWSTFEEEIEAYRRGSWDGIGFMFSADDEFAGIDLDGCRNPETGEIARWAREILDSTRTYCELSPSGTGYKLYGIGSNPLSKGKNWKVKDEPWISSKEPGVELYSKLRYFAVTGQHVEGYPATLEPIQPAIDALCDRFAPGWRGEAKPAQSNGGRVLPQSGGLGNLDDRVRSYLAKCEPAIAGQRGHNVTFRVACALVLGFDLTPDEALPYLAEWNRNCQPPWTEAELRHKVEDADKEPGERHYLLRKREPDTGIRQPPQSGTFQQDSPAAVVALPQWQPFPVKALPEPLRGFVATAADVMGCDPSYVALPLLTAVAAAVGRSRCLRIRRTWREPAVLWTAIVGESGTLKTPALSLATDALQHQQEAAFRDYDSAKAEYQNALLGFEADLAGWKGRRKKNGDEPPPEPPEPPVCLRYLVSDTTCEAMAPILRDNPRGILMSRDELAGRLRGQNEYKRGKGSDTANWLSAWQAGAWTVDRKSSGTIHIPAAAISVTGGIQPDVLREALGTLHISDGSAARLLMVYPPAKPKRWTDRDVPESVIATVADLIGRLLALPPAEGQYGPMPLDVTFSPDAKREWVEFYNRHNREMDDVHGALRSAYAKLEAYCARLSLLLALVRDPHTLFVNAESVRAAVRLVEWFAAEARRIYGLVLASAASAESCERLKLVDFIKRRGGRITANDLRRRTGQYDTSEDAERALTQLVGMGYGDWQRQPPTAKGGRPTSVFVLREAASVSETPFSPEENGGLGYGDNEDATQSILDDEEPVNAALQESVVEDRDEWGTL